MDEGAGKFMLWRIDLPAAAAAPTAFAHDFHAFCVGAPRRVCCRPGRRRARRRAAPRALRSPPVPVVARRPRLPAPRLYAVLLSPPVLPRRPACSMYSELEILPPVVVPSYCWAARRCPPCDISSLHSIPTALRHLQHRAAAPAEQLARRPARYISCLVRPA